MKTNATTAYVIIQYMRSQKQREGSVFECNEKALPCIWFEYDVSSGWEQVKAQRPCQQLTWDACHPASTHKRLKTRKLYAPASYADVTAFFERRVS